MNKMRTIIHTVLLLAAVSLTAAFTSCRQESDMVNEHNGMDYATAKASTYTEKWDLLWAGFNQNYVGWEMETVDWDETNSRLRPQFQQLDEKVKAQKEGKATLDSTALISIANEANNLLHEAFDTLHDGHVTVGYTDYAVGLYASFSPSDIRAEKRKDYYDEHPSGKAYYIDEEEIEHYTRMSDSNVRWKLLDLCISKIISNKMDSLLEHIHQIEAAGKSPDPADVQKLEQLKNFDLFMSNVCDKYSGELNKYSDASKVMTMLIRDLKFDHPEYYEIIKETGVWDIHTEKLPELETYTTNDGIVGLSLSAFLLPDISTVQNATRYDSLVCRWYNAAIREFHDSVYSYHEAGKLKGVIIDVRHNNGGHMADLGVVAGALLQGSKYVFGTVKQKNGTGRLDYSLPMEMSINLPYNNAEAITEPIVVLADAQSVSCSENTVATVKQQANGIMIGARTYGAACPVVSNPLVNSTLNYAGCIGTAGGPVYAYIPYMLLSFNKIGNIEGKGIEPDIELHFDSALYRETKRDNQFERALKYIREKQ